MLGMLVVTYWMTVIFLNILPLVGALAASLAIPGLSVGLMQAARNIERGQPVGLQTLYGSFKDNARTLFALGGTYLCATLGVLSMSAVIDGGELLRFMLSSSPADRAAIDSTDFMIPGLFVMAAITPVIMAYWFAPVLAAWHRLSLGRSLFFSFMACWMNWRPFLTYGLGLLLVGGVIPGVFLGLLLVILPAGANFVTALVTVPMLMIVAPVIFASFYVCYRDIFGISEIV